MLSIENLSLHLGERQVLKNINFHMEESSFHVVVGPNGVGKSSLLKCILAQHRYEGSIKLNGLDNRELTDRRRARLVAYVPQFPDLQFNLDVHSFMKLSRYAHDRESPLETERIIDQNLALTETEHLKYAYLDEISGGERQRVLIAAALAQHARLLILDEPSNSLDPAHRRDLARLLAQLYREEQLAILMVTHDWNELMHLQPKFLALKDGSVAFTCTTEELPTHLEPLFDCRFEHFQVQGTIFSLAVDARLDGT